MWRNHWFCCGANDLDEGEHGAREFYSMAKLYYFFDQPLDVLGRQTSVMRVKVGIGARIVQLWHRHMVIGKNWAAWSGAHEHRRESDQYSPCLALPAQQREDAWIDGRSYPFCNNTHKHFVINVKTISYTISQNRITQILTHTVYVTKQCVYFISHIFQTSCGRQVNSLHTNLFAK